MFLSLRSIDFIPRFTVAFSACFAVFRGGLAVSFACWHARVCWVVAVVGGGWGGWANNVLV